MKKCKYCIKVLSSQKVKAEAVFCNRKCFNKYCKKNNCGFYSFEVQSKAGKLGIKKCHKVCKQKKIGAWCLNKKEKKFGTFGFTKKQHNIFANRAVVYNRKNNIGPWFNPELNREMRERSSRNRRSLYSFNGVFFDSRCECEIAMCLYYQYNLNLEFRKTVHFLIGRKEFDFFVENLKLFIEYHRWDRKHGRNLHAYIKDRRKILDLNGYKDYNLLVITWQ